MLPPGGDATGLKRRCIPLAIIFSIITFGIYYIYWMIRLNNAINKLSGEPEATGGGLVFLFSIITCGIYSYYWLYKMGERVDKIKGVNNGSTSIGYLVLGLFKLGIVSYALMQSAVNKALPEK
ncbi:MAG: DUF4234 domain-containing protein [Eubacterium sp.]|nr:DUF4234 domain-containing protein [Eubacterium sp.]